MRLLPHLSPLVRGEGPTLRHAIAWTCTWPGRRGARRSHSTAIHRLVTWRSMPDGLCGCGRAGSARGVAAWNFVVAGLLMALCRPFLEGLGSAPTGGACLLPGRRPAGSPGQLPADAAGADSGPAGESGAGWQWRAGGGARFGAAPGGATPWMGLLSARGNQGEDFDAMWRKYRDRFGFVWAQRLREEQFNRSACNAG